MIYYEFMLTFIKEVFYRKEIEIFRVGMTNEYGIRSVWRSRIKTPDGVSGWRKYSKRKGDSITMTTAQMLDIIDRAKLFVTFMKNAKE